MEGFPFLDIIIFAMIAAFLVFRLRTCAFCTFSAAGPGTSPGRRITWHNGVRSPRSRGMS